MTDNEIDIIAEGLYSHVQIVSRYMLNRWDNLIKTYITSSNMPHRDNCIKDLYCRALAWIKTLEKLNHPVNIQAIITAQRALLEILVDLIFLHNDKTNETGWKMYWWAQSERLKACEETMEFYQEMKLPIPSPHQIRIQALDLEKDEIDKMRKTLWPVKNPNKASPPKRWNGHDSKFQNDVKEADQIYGDAIKEDLEITLDQIYRTEFRYLSWFVHSGLASVWNIPSRTLIGACGAAFQQSANLGMSITKLVLKDFGFTDHLSNLEQEWEQIKTDRILSFFEVKDRRERQATEQDNAQIDQGSK